MPKAKKRSRNAVARERYQRGRRVACGSLDSIPDLPLLYSVSLWNVTPSDPDRVQQLRDRGVMVDGQP